MASLESNGLTYIADWDVFIICKGKGVQSFGQNRTPYSKETPQVGGGVLFRIMMITERADHVIKTAQYIDTSCETKESS